MHTIRLRDPWDATPQADGTVRFTRHFNRPTGLESGDCVWLVIEGAAQPLAVTLNGNLVGQASRLPAHDSARYEITPLLQPRNKLEIDLSSAPKIDALPALGEVRLEIESA
jgi:hypothetical protein